MRLNGVLLAKHGQVAFRGIRIVLCALAVVILAACSASSVSPSAQSSTAIRTPLQVRDLLRSLDVFNQCENPRDNDDPEIDAEVRGTVVTCYVLKQEQNVYGDATRRVIAFITKRPLTPAIQALCRTGSMESDVGAVRVVTDDQTYFVFGTRSYTFDGLWPDEVWPEDVQRVLGGTIRTLAEICTPQTG